MLNIKTTSVANNFERIYYDFFNFFGFSFFICFIEEKNWVYKYFVVSDTGKVPGEEGLIAMTLGIIIRIIFLSLHTCKCMFALFSCQGLSFIGERFDEIDLFVSDSILSWKSISLRILLEVHSI